MQITNQLESAQGNVLASPHKHLIALAHRFRTQRLRLFASLISRLPRPIRILDVGGTPLFWQSTGFPTDGLDITLYNLERFQVDVPNMRSLVGDARDMREFKDKQFDLVFSNSVIDYLETYADQQRMAQEVQRVSMRYFVQVPNRHFPIEPHFVLPYVQYLPLPAKIWLYMHANGWASHHAIQDKQAAEEFVRRIRLMTKKEVRALFPGAHLYQERFFGLVKSFVAYGGF